MEVLQWSQFKALVDSVNAPIYSFKEDSNFINLFLVIESVLFSCDINKSSGDYTVFQASYRSKLNPISFIKQVNGSTSLATDELLNEGIQGSLTVGTSAIEIKVGASPLPLRKLVTLFNNSNATLYWGYTSAVTTGTGTPIFKDQLVEWPVSENISLFVIAGTAGNNTRITEAS